MSITQAPRSAVRLPAGAREMIAAECARRPGVETAGVIFMDPDDGSGYATGPGPDAVCTRDGCEWGASYIFHRLDAMDAAGDRLLGRWHKHTAPILLASDTDKESARAFLAATGMPEMLDLIVACDEHDRPIGWAVYVCTPEEYRRAELEWSET